MARPLADVVKDAVPIPRSMPLVHITDAYHIEAVVRSASLLPTACDVFKRDLLYLFYGRPAYKTRRDENPYLLFDLPVVFVLRPDAKLGAPHRAFPLDTGAFSRGYYKGHFHKDTPIERLEIGASDDDLRRYIGLFYESPLDYYVGRATKNLEILPTEFDLQGLHELARQPTSPSINVRTPLDERASSVELQFSTPISLVDNTLIILLPGVFLGEKEIRAKIDDINPVYLETYDIMHGMGPQGMASIIYDRLLAVYRKEGILA